MPNVLIVIGSMHPTAGGPPRVAAGSAIALARAGVAVEIITIGDEGDETVIARAWPALAQTGVCVRIFPPSGLRALGRSIGLHRFVAAEIERFDAVHIHGVWEMALGGAAWIARGAGKPTLVSPHGMLDRWQLRQSRWKKLPALAFLRTGSMLRKADALLYGSTEEAQEGRDLRLPGSVVVMPNGVDPVKLPTRADALAMMTSIAPQIATWGRTILFFSRIHPKKGLDMLVEAMALIASRHPDAGLLAVAIPQDEAYEAMIRSRILELGERRIVLVTDIVGPAARSVFALADIFALPSHQEGFSIAILEAMSAGLALLITDRCHMPEVEDWQAGYVAPATVDGLAAGLAVLLAKDRAELIAIGARGRAKADAEFSWDAIAGRLANLYKELARVR